VNAFGWSGVFPLKRGVIDPVASHKFIIKVWFAAVLRRVVPAFVQQSKGWAMIRSPIQQLYHFAYPCRDAEETRHFYEDLLGLPLAHCMQVDAVPSSGESGPYAHIFFQMGDGSYVAFFDLGKNEAPLPSPNTPRWVHHLALQVPTIDDVLAYKAKLEAAGVEVRGLVNHDFIQSIYFFDPNGLRLELTTRTDAPGFLEKAASEAHHALDAWTKAKRGFLKETVE
jgi:catechol 2,3-dioxygenase-like lactoylglutathione lyase family enzyme